MAKRFSGNELAVVVTQFSTCAPTAIADTGIAAANVASKPAANSGGAPTGGTNRARKGNSIIATGSGNTGAGPVKCSLA